MSLLTCCAPLSHEARLLRDCYPPSKQLVPPPLRNSSSPSSSTHINLDDSYKPLSQELSRLTYHASNKPGTLNLLGRELEDKVMGDLRKARGGNQKSRLYVLLSLQILRSLITECKRDLALFSRSALKIMDQSIGLALAGGGRKGLVGAGAVDLEMSVRVGACFTAFATYSTAQSLGSDDALSKTYISTLRQFASLATKSSAELSPPSTSSNDEKPHNVDPETRNRTRLIGLAALSAAGGSDLLFAGSSDFGEQSRVIVPALLGNLALGMVEGLKMEGAKVNLDNNEPFPYFSEFSARPAMANRRAPSLRNHVAGEKGPATADVVGASLRTLKNLISQCQANQLSQVLLATISYINGKSIWQDTERCCWLGETITTFSMMQYRFVIPTALLEELTGCAVEIEPSVKVLTLLAMLTTIFSARKLSLVGVSTTELLGSVCNIIVKRVEVSLVDPTLPALVDCVSSLGCHTYYADQTNDFIEELIARIGQVQLGGWSRAKSGVIVTPPQDPKKKAVQAETVRIMVACMTNIMLSRPANAVSEDEASFPLTVDGDQVPGSATTMQHSQETSGTISRRNPISPAVWQESLPLLCESSFAIRAEYARSLILYLKQECPAAPGREEEEANTNNENLGNPTQIDPLKTDLARFLNALFATLYTLAVSTELGFAGIAKAKEDIKTLEQKVHAQAKPATDGIIATGAQETDSPIAKSNASLPADNGNEGGDDLVSPLAAGRPSTSSRPGTFGRRSSKLVSLPFTRSETDHSRRNSLATLPTESSGPLQEDVAGSFDYLVIQEVLALVFQKNRPLSVLLGAPMLLALDREIPLIEPSADTRALAATKRACREVLLSSWTVIADSEHPGMSDLKSSVTKAQSTVSPPNIVCKGPITQARSGLFTPDKPVEFSTAHLPKTNSLNTSPLIAPEVVIKDLARAPDMQQGLGMSENALTHLLGTEWTVEEALKNSVENFGPSPISRSASYTRTADGMARGSNPSLNSQGQDGARGVDLSDLREALSASRNGSVTGLASIAPSAASIRSGNTDRLKARNGLGGEKKKIKPEEAREILKDIFSKKKNGRRPDSRAVVV